MPAVTFYIVGTLDTNIVAGVLNLAQQLSQPATPPAVAPTELIIPINSLGGDIGSAIAIYNVLRSLKLQVTTHNIGEVTSAANIVFLAGEKRLACKRSYFRHHGTFYAATGHSHRVVYEDIVETLKIGESIMSDIIIERTKLTAGEIQNYFHSPVTITPDAALKAGIIHEIREIG